MASEICGLGAMLQLEEHMDTGTIAKASRDGKLDTRIAMILTLPRSIPGSLAR